MNGVEACSVEGILDLYRNQGLLQLEVPKNYGGKHVS